MGSLQEVTRTAILSLILESFAVWEKKEVNFSGAINVEYMYIFLCILIGLDELIWNFDMRERRRAREVSFDLLMWAAGRQVDGTFASFRFVSFPYINYWVVYVFRLIQRMSAHTNPNYGY